MRVRMLRNLGRLPNTDAEPREEGCEYEVSDNEAAALVAGALAEVVEVKEDTSLKGLDAKLKAKREKKG